MLLDSNTYQKLKCDPTKEFSIALERILLEGVHISSLDKRQMEYFLVNDPICPCIP